jgi:hypothetical protein
MQAQEQKGIFCFMGGASVSRQSNGGGPPTLCVQQALLLVVAYSVSNELYQKNHGILIKDRDMLPHLVHGDWAYTGVSRILRHLS